MTRHCWHGTSLSAPTAVPLDAGACVAWTRAAPEPNRVNEDAAAVLPLPDGGAVLVVADGMGGHAGAADAARHAVQSLARACEGLTPEGEARSAILDGIEHAHAAIRALGVGAGATLVVAHCTGGQLRPYHIGDAGCLVVGQRGRRKFASTPHSPVGYAVEAGVLDPGEAMHHAERHVVSNALGADDMHMQVGSARPLAARDTVLLASDGLLDNLHEDEIIAAIRSGPLPAAAERLVALVDARMAGTVPGTPSKPDDCTFVLFRPRRARA